MQQAEPDDFTPQYQIALALRDLREALMHLKVPDRTRVRLQFAHDRVERARDMLESANKLPPVPSLPPLPAEEEV